MNRTLASRSGVPWFKTRSDHSNFESDTGSAQIHVLAALENTQLVCMHAV